MRESIVDDFKRDLHGALENFEKESGGRHNRRPEISRAINTLEEYITRAQNPLILLNNIEVYIKNYLSGFFKSLVFRDEYQLKRFLYAILAQPEYSLQSLSHSLYHEAEIEKLSLYRLIAQLEERLRSVESGKEESGCESVGPIAQSEFDDLRAKISHLEDFEKHAQIKISELESEKWMKEREIISLRAKIELLTIENSKLQVSQQKQQEELEKLRAENQRLKAEATQQPETLIRRVAPQLVYQNNSKPINTIPQEIKNEDSCRIV